MSDVRRELHVPLEVLTQRVTQSDNLEEKTLAFQDWLLRVIGIDGVTGMESVNQIMQAEFGSHAGFKDGVTYSREHRRAALQFHEKRNGDIIRKSR